MIHYWLNLISAVFIGCSIAVAFILWHLSSQNKSSMRIMRPVWTLTGVWAGIFALPAYAWLQKGKTRFTHSHKQVSRTEGMAINCRQHAMPENKGMAMMDMDMNMPMDNMNAPSLSWHSVILSTLHCGAGCTLADIIGDWITYFYPISIGGSPLWGNWTLNFALALLIGVFFQYAAIREMQSITTGRAIAQAVKADALSLTAWQIGMYCWMALAFFVFFKGEPLPKTTWTYWLMMQLAMFCGFILALPVNALLIKAGIKQGM